jgi:hypothetical protein
MRGQVLWCWLALGTQVHIEGLFCPYRRFLWRLLGLRVLSWLGLEGRPRAVWYSFCFQTYDNIENSNVYASLSAPSRHRRNVPNILDGIVGQAR